ncbi:hypothetical protein K7X08_035162 [Anisodus acutangulus]|uniref:Uncharacterized protein n=1 Tax=Anisodus acutangulus TaxID=402998 RepID=A0A9Q1R240_9SOLA|nr:hypothetical protein K7X08_035162 [Anisodus acutangulus]
MICQSLLNFTTPYVLEINKEETKLTVICQAAWNNFLTGFGGYFAEFQAAVQALASLDCLNSLAILSRNKNYVRPLFVNDDEAVQIHIFSGRHPLPVTCIQRAIVIAGRLEAAGCNYTEQNRTRMSSSVSYRESCCKESESVEDVIEPGCLSAGRVEGLDDMSELYRRLFLNLNFTLLEEHDDGRRLQFLIQARSLAAQLVIR